MAARRGILKNPLEGAAIDGLRGQGAQPLQGFGEEGGPVDRARHLLYKVRKTAKKGKTVLAQLCQGGKERSRDGEFLG
jgi:hypothetical protein